MNILGTEEWFTQSDRESEDDLILAMHKFAHDAPHLIENEWKKGNNPWLSCFLTYLSTAKTNLFMAYETGLIDASVHEKLALEERRIEAEVIAMRDSQYPNPKDEVPEGIKKILFGELYGLLPDGK